jgi:hypothetical protein
MGKAGKDPEHRRSMGECETPTSLIVQGLADQVVVVMIPVITSRRSKGPVDMVVLGEEGGWEIAQRAINSCGTREMSC